MKDKNKKIITIVVIFIIIFTVIGSTLAYFSWVSSEEQQTNVTFTAEADFSCSADGGGNITSGSVTIVPTTCDNSEHVIKRTVTTSVVNDSDKTVYLDLWLDINTLGNYLSDDEHFNYILSTSSSCTDEESIVESGNFYLNSTGEKKKLIRDREYPSSGTDTYYLYIWLDAEETEIPEEDTTTREFDLSLNGNCSNTSTPEEPVLDENLVTTVSSNNDDYVVTPLVSTNNSVVASTLDTSTSTTSGMIPVVISNDGTVKTVYKDSIQWYDYDQKEWANVVLVTEGTRSKYVGTEGVTVSSSDILAYFVWIPRYKYKIWTLTNSANGKEQQIDIIFQDLEEGVATGTEIGEFLTHPAFEFGGEQLAGIWVGKFETTKGTTSNVGTSNPTVLPNITSWTSQNISNQFQTSLKFAGGTLTDGVVSFEGSSTYGLSSSVDSHMMKNVDWGAVAYLSRSEYGINEEIRINNYYYSGGYLTGCGALTENEATATTCGIPYGGATEYPQSTTGNISGIFDMSGGAHDYIMGVLTDSNGKPMSGSTTSYNSGFNGTLTDETTYEDGIDFPPEKYYDLLTTSITSCSNGKCYGHSAFETLNWYGDKGNFWVTVNRPWLSRGGSYGNSANAGIFMFDSERGHAYAFTFRTALVIK